MKVKVGQGQLAIIQEGRSAKFMDAVEQVTFSGRLAAESGQPVLFITERCVFRLGEGGLELIEVAPGIDVERDVLAHMAFKPLVNEPKLMDFRLFRDEPMGLDGILLERPLSQRLSLDEQAGVLYIDLDGYRVRTLRDVEAVREAVAGRVAPLGRKVAAIISYDAFAIAPELNDAWFAMAADVESLYYSHVSRYTTSAFMRLKLGEALSRRDVAPHIFETPQQARTSIALRAETD